MQDPHPNQPGEQRSVPWENRRKLEEDLKEQMEMKKRLEEQKKLKDIEEEQKLEKRFQDQQERMQKEFEEEIERRRKKIEEKSKNENSKDSNKATAPKPENENMDQEKKFLETPYSPPVPALRDRTNKSDKISEENVEVLGIMRVIFFYFLQYPLLAQLKSMRSSMDKRREELMKEE